MLPMRTHEQRVSILQDAIADRLRQGWRVEMQATPYAATLTKGQPVNHILHLLLSIFTCGFWVIGWIIVAATGGVQRQTVAVDPYGRITR